MWSFLLMCQFTWHQGVFMDHFGFRVVYYSIPVLFVDLVLGFKFNNIYFVYILLVVKNRKKSEWFLPKKCRGHMVPSFGVFTCITLFWLEKTSASVKMFHHFLCTLISVSFFQRPLHFFSKSHSLLFLFCLIDTSVLSFFPHGL